MIKVTRLTTLTTFNLLLSQCDQGYQTHHIDLFQPIPFRIVDVFLYAGLTPANQAHMPCCQGTQGYKHAEADDELKDDGLVVGRLGVG